MDVLNELLEGYDARKRTQREEYEREQQRSKEIAEKATRILSAIAIPALSKIADAVTAKGHHCDVVDRGGTIVTLEFRPSQSSLSRHPSHLSFVVRSDGILRVLQTVESSPRAMSEKTWSLDDLSEAKVESKAMAFIESVLRDN